MADKGGVTNKQALATLQAELLSLKERFQGALHLHKASVVPDRSSGPFPIRVSFVVKAPAAAGAYDVQDFKVIVTLLAASTDHTLTANSRVQGVAIQIQSAELPLILKERMAERLKASWASAFGQGLRNSMHLGVIFDAAQQDFVSLLTLLPELAEAYESVDARGASARRYAIVDPDSHIEVLESSHMAHGTDGDESTSNLPSARHSKEGLTGLDKANTAITKSEPAEEQMPSPSSNGQLSSREDAIYQPTEPAWSSAAQGLRGEQQTLMAAARPASRPDQAQQPGTDRASLASFPEQAQPDILFLQRRYLHSVTLLPEDGPCFLLQLEPTDPSWQRGKLLHLKGKVASTYPAAGSLEFSCKQTPDMEADVCAMLDRILAAHIAALGSWKQGNGAVKYDLLRRVVREIDNSGGQFLHLAQDVLLQNAGNAHSISALSAASMHASASTAPRVRTERFREGHSAGKANGIAEPEETAAGPRPDWRALESDSVQAVDGMASLDLSGSSQHDTCSISCTDAEDGTDEEWDTGSTSSQEEEGGGHVRSEHGGLPSAPEMGNSSLEMHLDGLKLDNIDALEILRLNLQVACNRCGTMHEVSLATEAAAAGQLEQAGTCSTCSRAWSVGMRPLLVHAHSSCLARIRTEGCAPRDLLPSLYAAQCGGCSSIASFRSVQVGAPCERNCSHCHMAMGTSFSVARFQQHAHAPASQYAKGPGTGGLQGGAVAPRAAGGSAPLQPGQPLPNLGVCKHYAHSYRLLRFPCCGRRFSCDLCHEEATDGHEMKWAHRMVCGFCSVEQPLGDRCKHCNKKLAHNASGAVGNRTRHWEGGEGCRNKKLLDRRDAAKYRNSKYKTVSKKSSRVGQEGARRRKKAAAA